jgi:hypothetical protein
MNTLSVKSWEEFEQERDRILSSTSGGIPGWLFRGQERAEWSLETTLERTLSENHLVCDYYRSIARIKPRIETFTEARWEMPADLRLSEYDTFSVALSMGAIPAYAYLIYLRHHGFPSPLLDWTKSPHIAAFFAFRRETHSDVSIYMYTEAPENMKSRGSDAATIHRFGPNIRSHRRHFLQQSEYTICVQFSDQLWRFAKHENVFAKNSQHQDLLWKFTIPSSERRKVLKQLDGFNLNAFSLFGTEESLLETLAVRELQFRPQTARRLA